MNIYVTLFGVIVIVPFPKNREKLLANPIRYLYVLIHLALEK